MSLELNGIDGKNPLGFVAALGVVACVGGRLQWQAREAGWVPVITGLDPARETPVSLADELYRKLNPMPYAYRLASDAELPYDDFKERTADERIGSKRKQATIRAVTESALRAAIASMAGEPVELERIAAHTCVVALRNQKISVTEVRSVSGQVRYLANLRSIVEQAKRDDIYRALFERWLYRPGPKLGLDPDGYIENVAWNVGKLGSVSEIGAERLALEGLRGLPTSVSRGRLVTRGYRGQRFRWPLSSAPRTFRTTSDLIGSSHLFDKPDQLRAWMAAHEVAEVNESEVFRYGQGYKTLRPAIRVG
jgi:hypothetical protein